MSDVYNKDLGTKQKALAINLDPKIYGSFAETGAGQDVAAYFFKAGASSGTTHHVACDDSTTASGEQEVNWF